MAKKRSASRSRQLRLVSSQPRLAERAWARHTFGRPWAPEGWFELVERFVADKRPRDPERTAAALLLALDNCAGPDRFVEGGWIYLVTTHVYVHFEGGGMGSLRALQLCDDLVVWLGKRGDLHEWDVACLRHRVDQQRACNGGRRRGVPVAWENWEWNDTVDTLVGEFLRAGAAPDTAPVVDSIVHLLASATELRGTSVVRFGALDAADLWEPLLEGEATAAEEAEHEAFVRDVARIGAAFYRWLREAGRLEPGRAERLERQLAGMAALPTLSPRRAPSC